MEIKRKINIKDKKILIETNSNKKGTDITVKKETNNINSKLLSNLIPNFK